MRLINDEIFSFHLQHTHTVLPLSGPQIIGVQPSYKVGDEGK